MNKNKKDENENKSKINQVGGMALLDGVMMKSQIKSVCATRKQDGSIVVDELETSSVLSNKKIKKIPIVRGVFAFVDSLITGMKAMYKSAAEIEIENGEEVETLSNKEIGISFFIALIMSVGLFILLPNLVSNFLFPIENIANKKYYNLTEGLVKFALFIGYILLVSRMEEIKKTFRYHGAEHKSIMCYESGKRLTVENVKKATRFHPRCGTSFILIVFITSLIVGYFIYFPVLWKRILSKVILLPLISGIAYEFIIYSNKKDNIVTRILKEPGLLMQRLTTKEPTNDEIEVGIASLLESLEKKEYITLEEMLKEYKDKYKIETNDLYRIVSSRLNITKEKIIANMKEISVSYLDYINIKNMLERYVKKHEPLQYILGKQEFYGLDFNVEKGILVPRADTEILVENAINEIEKNQYKTCIDMCAGSGCIGISIAKKSNIEKVTLVDISDVSKKVVNKNIEKNKCKTKCKFLKSNLFENVSNEKVDIIVSNPPYIKSFDISKLDKVVQNEPKLALDGGKDGLKFYKKIVKEAQNYLKKDGVLFFEIGFDQASEVIKILEEEKVYENIEVIKDYGGNDRVIKTYKIK